MDKIDELLLRIQELEQRIIKLEAGRARTGVYTTGVPEYVRDYIRYKKEELKHND